jgi:hypothetical protein
VRDRAALAAAEAPEALAELRALRPDLIGGVRAWLGDDRFVELAYFTSEEDARKGEASTQFSEQADAYLGSFEDMTYIDLHEPLMI